MAVPTEMLVIANSLDEMPRLEAWLADLSARWGLSAGAAFRVDLIVNEAVTNVVTHSFSGIGEHEVQIGLTLLPDAVRVEVVDDGVEFNPFTVPPRPPATDLSEAPIGGLGVPLIRRYTSARGYERTGGRNRLTLMVLRGD